MTAEFRLIPGGGDLVAVLEDTLARVRAGEIEGIVLCGITSDHSQGWTWSHTDGIAVPWARLLAAVDTAHHDLIDKGLEP